MPGLNVTLCAEKCPATQEKWRCEKCAALIGDTFDVMLANGGGVIIPDDFDFGTKKRYENLPDVAKGIKFKDESRKTLIYRASRECQYGALSIESF